MRHFLLAILGAALVVGCGPMPEDALAETDVFFTEAELASAMSEVHQGSHELEFFNVCTGNPVLMNIHHHVAMRMVMLSDGTYKFGFNETVSLSYTDGDVSYSGRGNVIQQENSNSRNFTAFNKMSVRAKGTDGSYATFLIDLRIVVDANGQVQVYSDVVEMSCK